MVLCCADADGSVWGSAPTGRHLTVSFPGERLTQPAFHALPCGHPNSSPGSAWFRSCTPACIGRTPPPGAWDDACFRNQTSPSRWDLQERWQRSSLVQLPRHITFAQRSGENILFTFAMMQRRRAKIWRSVVSRYAQGHSRCEMAAVSSSV